MWVMDRETLAAHRVAFLGVWRGKNFLDLQFWRLRGRDLLAHRLSG